MLDDLTGFRFKTMSDAYVHKIIMAIIIVTYIAYGFVYDFVLLILRHFSPMYAYSACEV